MVERPKQVNLLMFLWIIACLILAYQSWHYYMDTFIWQVNLDMIPIPGYFLFNISTYFYLLMSIFIIFSITNVKKYSWLLNIIFSVHFLFYFGFFSFYILHYVIFYDNLDRYFQNMALNPNFFGWGLSNAIIACIMLIILIFLFRPNVKKYFNQI